MEEALRCHTPNLRVFGAFGFSEFTPQMEPQVMNTLNPRADKACAEVSRAVLNGKKKVFRYTFFPKKPEGTPCVQPWLVAVGGWRRLAVGSWQLAVGGGWWWLAAVGGW